MIKRIIFDLDNTLIKWKTEYNQTVVRTYRKFNIDIDEKLLEEFNLTLKKYENNTTKFNKKEMTLFYNKNYKKGMPDGFIDEWLIELSYAVPDDIEELEDTLRYLSSKYKLVVLTNWFTSSQVARLEKLNILKYFDKVIGTDQVVMKPDKEAFIFAKGDDEFNECIMVGDDIKIDLETPRKLGMDTILITDKSLDYDKKISKINELKEML